MHLRYYTTKEYFTLNKAQKNDLMKRREDADFVGNGKPGRSKRQKGIEKGSSKSVLATAVNKR